MCTLTFLECEDAMLAYSQLIATLPQCWCMGWALDMLGLTVVAIIHHILLQRVGIKHLTHMDMVTLEKFAVSGPGKL